MSFEHLKLIEPIHQALKAEGYTSPTPIQERAIPVILQGRDLLGSAQTGTGKTAAFAVPILQMLYQRNGIDTKRRPIRALIITPTRELALQIGDSFDAYGKNTQLKKAVIFGGVNQNPQTDALRKGVDILIATPGRLLDLMGQGFVHLKQLQVFVLDEADRMLDMGFIQDINKIIAALPQKRQSLFFSATMPPAIVKLAGSIVQNPVEVSVAPVMATADLINQSVYFVNKANKNDLLMHVLRDRTIASALVFTRTKYGADKVSRILNKNGIQSEAIHGNKSQSARQKALALFKDKKIRVLVASDIAARGIDVEELSCVINYEIPNIPETYVHRIGRTGRAGVNGIALSFCDPAEKSYLKDIYKLISREIPVVESHPYASEIDDNTEPPAIVRRSRRENNTKNNGKKRAKNKKRWYHEKR
jgi:ATP-dependent RNA helicase RhlE